LFYYASFVGFPLGFGLVLESIIAVFGLIPAATAYIPLYDDYLNGCVHSTSGTFFTNNLYALCYNFASTDGNAELEFGLEEYDKTRISECTSMTNEADPENQDLTSRYNSASNQHETVFQKMSLFEYCVDPSTFPSNFYANFSVLPPTTIATPAQSPQCWLPLAGPLEPAAFNCTLLPRCDITCTGPSQQNLNYATFETGCRTEWLIHSLIFRGMITIVVFICFNISRVLFMMAVCRMQWRSLTTEGFEFVGNCSRSGKTSVAVKTKLQEEINETIKSFEQTATFLFLGSLLVHLPYLIFILVLTSPIANQ